MSHGYCQDCAAPMAPAMIGGRERPQCPVCGFVLWRNPAPVGMALIEHHGRLVMIRRREPPLADYWAPPAGYVECGESVTDAVVREAEEESGLRIELGSLLGVYSQADVNVLIIAFAARSVGGVARAGDDASELRLYPPNGLPRQPAPDFGTATERWFHGVIETVLDRWRLSASQH